MINPYRAQVILEKLAAVTQGGFRTAGKYTKAELRAALKGLRGGERKTVKRVWKQEAAQAAQAAKSPEQIAAEVLAADKAKARKAGAIFQPMSAAKAARQKGRNLRREARAAVKAEKPLTKRQIKKQERAAWKAYRKA